LETGKLEFAIKFSACSQISKISNRNTLDDIQHHLGPCYDRPMSADDPEVLDLADWPDARDAYRTAYELARRDVADAPIRHPGDPDPARDLATLRKRVQLRGLDPAAQARIRLALEWAFP
jgi:hypothetical protein